MGLVLLLALFGWAQGFISGVLALAGLAPRARGWARGSARWCSRTARSRRTRRPFGLLGALVVGAMLAGLFEAFGGQVRRGLAAMPGFGRRRAARRGAGRVRRARRRLDPRRARRAERHLRAARGGPALGDPAAAQHDAAAVRAAAELAAPRSTPSRASTGPRRTSAPPRAGIARDPRCRRPPRAWSRCSGPRAGSASRAPAGSRRRASWSRTRTSWPASATREVLLGGREPGLRGAGGPLRRAQRPRDPARARPRRATPLPLDREPARRARRRRSWASRSTGPFDVRPGGWARRSGCGSSDAYGRGPVERSMTALRGLVRSGNSGRADGRRRGPRRHDDLRRHHARAARRLRRARTRSWRGRWRTSAARSRPVPARASEPRCPPPRRRAIGLSGRM